MTFKIIREMITGTASRPVQALSRRVSYLNHPLPFGSTGRNGSDPEHAPTLNAEELQTRARKNMKIIALFGLFLILADLGLSFTEPSVQIIRDDGRLYLIRPAAGDDAGHISLKATVKSGSEVYEDNFDIRLDPQEKRSDDAPAQHKERKREPSPEEVIRNEFRTIAAGFNEDLEHRRVPLPLSLDSGEAIRWNRVRSTNTLLLAGMTGIMLLLVYRSRMRPLQKLEESRKQSVRLQLPAFLNELVLLLNAGLVLSRAFETTVELTTSDGDTDYFRRNIRGIYSSVKNTNAPMHAELNAFARESGVSELMRVSNIISDNINKGAQLTLKLERESEGLWVARKLRAEERGRLAETKMTLPLSIFLSVLILITVAPALLEL